MVLQFPSPGMQVLSSVIHFLGVSILTHCVSRRVAAEDLMSWRSLQQTPWVRLCAILVFIDSWLFLMSTGIVIFGVGLETSGIVCAAAIYLCVFFYATSKFLIYCLLIEKIHLVWSVNNSPRLKSPVYLVSAVTVGLYGGVIVVMFIGRNFFLREHDDACVIGLKTYASITMLSYDLYINIFLTSLFLWPLLRLKLVNQRVRRVARRTLVAATAALTTSTINMLVLTIMKGHQLGWVCLGACGADVILNALALFWVTGGTSSTPSPSFANNSGKTPGTTGPSSDGQVSHARRTTRAGMPSSPRDVGLALVTQKDVPPIPPNAFTKVSFGETDTYSYPPTTLSQTEERSGSQGSRGFFSMFTRSHSVSKSHPRPDIQVTVTTQREVDQDIIEDIERGTRASKSPGTPDSEMSDRLAN